ncbi:MAG TPA: BspA family leucine-rich repeat surface protein [Campylobacterales bacterium]|nr:BspA family leucine-rich repeat surface protein [Campylobacterales bacterium]
MIKNGEDVTRVDVSEITDMSRLFYEQRDFNQPIGNWDVSNVTHMNSMLYGLGMIFNQPIGNWNVRKVTNMSFHILYYYNL